MGAPLARLRFNRSASIRTAREGTAKTVSKMPHLLAYRDDADTRSRRLTKRMIVAVLVVFGLFQGLVFAFFAPYLIPIFLVVPAVLLALIVWALPDSRNPPTRTMDGLFVALFIVILIWPNYLAISLPGLPWITLIRLIAFPMIFLLAISFSQSQAVREEISLNLKSTPWIWRGMLVLMAIIFVTLPISKFVTQSLQKTFLIFTNWFGVYLVSVYFFRKKNRVEFWVGLLCALMIALGLIAVAEAHVRHVLWSNSIPSFLKVQDPTIIAILKGGNRRFTDVYRTQTTFESPLGFGEFIALVFPYALYFIVADRYKLWVRIAAAVMALFFIYVALLSGSRSAVLGSLVAAMLTLAVWGLTRWRNRKDSLLGPAVVLSYPVAGALVLASTIIVGRIRNRVWGGAETASSTQARTDQWHQGIPHLLSNPIGYGAENAGEILNYRLPNGQLVIDSYFLKVLLDWGIMGFVVLFGTIVAAMIYAGRIIYENDREDPEMDFAIPAAISLFTWVTIKFVNAEESNHPIIFMTLGMITALAYRQSKNRRALA